MRILTKGSDVVFTHFWLYIQINLSVEIRFMQDLGLICDFIKCRALQLNIFLKKRLIGFNILKRKLGLAFTKRISVKQNSIYKRNCSVSLSQ